MAKLRFEIEGEPSNVAADTFIVATRDVLRLLHEMDTVISGRLRGTLTWYVAALNSNGGLVIDLLSKLRPVKDTPPDFGRDVARSFVVGLDNIATRGSSPPYLSEFGLQRMGQMFDLLNKNGAKAYRVSNLDDRQSVKVSASVGDALRQLLPVRRSALGSIEGQIRTVSINRIPHLVVYHAVSNKGVTCQFRDNVLFQAAAAALGRRVAVSGTVHTNIKLEPVRVDVQRLRELGVGVLPTTKELAGSDPDFTGGLSTEAFIRSIRGE